MQLCCVGSWWWFQYWVCVSITHKLGSEVYYNKLYFCVTCVSDLFLNILTIYLFHPIFCTIHPGLQIPSAKLTRNIEPNTSPLLVWSRRHKLPTGWKGKQNQELLAIGSVWEIGVFYNHKMGSEVFLEILGWSIGNLFPDILTIFSIMFPLFCFS